MRDELTNLSFKYKDERDEADLPKRVTYINIDKSRPLTQKFEELVFEDNFWIDIYNYDTNKIIHRRSTSEDQALYPQNPSTLFLHNHQDGRMQEHVSQVRKPAENRSIQT